MDQHLPKITNIKEILNVSYQSFDVKTEAEKTAIQKLFGSEIHNFHFYDIPIQTDLSASPETDQTSVFKSIHKLGGNKSLSNEQKNSMQNGQNDITFYERKIIKDIRKKEPNLLLGEM